jgi:hypothetical protein
MGKFGRLFLFFKIISSRVATAIMSQHSKQVSLIRLGKLLLFAGLAFYLIVCGSQSSLFNAADEAFQMLPTNKPIFLIGESLGSGVASYLAGTYPDKISGLVLISPFNRLTSVAQNHYPILPVRLLLVDRFPSEKYLRNYHGKVGITVDGKDTIVPEKFGLRLYNSCTGPKKLWEFPDGGHCQIMKPQTEFWKEVAEFWQTNSSSQK